MPLWPNLSVCRTGVYVANAWGIFEETKLMLIVDVYAIRLIVLIDFSYIRNAVVYGAIMWRQWVALDYTVPNWVSLSPYFQYKIIFFWPAQQISQTICVVQMTSFLCFM